jgi:hypothetical protein
VRLVPVDADRERQIASLIASCETLRAEWERLFQRVVDLLNNDERQGRDNDRRSSLSD